MSGNLSDEVVPPTENDIIYDGVDTDRPSDIEEKILRTIRCSFPRPLTKKLHRLFLFIVTFGDGVISINQKGNVLIRGRLLDPNSNVLDLLAAAVSDHLTSPPAGFPAFLQALRDINVPSNFIHIRKEVGKWHTEKQSHAVGRWKPY